MEPAAHLAHLEADVERMLAAADGRLDAPVAACPGWTVSDLVGHQAGVHRFAAAQLRAEPGSALVPFDPPEPGPPLEVLRRAADEVLEALRATDPADHRPNWAGAPTAAFWFRRMAQETVVHRADAELAAGGAAGPIDAGLALDGIDELAEVFLPQAERRGIVGAGETVHLHATDEDLPAPGEWTFTFRPDGVGVEHHHGKGDMAVRGPAGDLLLFAWNRRPVAVECFGEPDPLAFWSRTVRI